MLDIRDWAGADDGNDVDIKYINNTNITDLMHLYKNKPQGRIRQAGIPMNQDEFKNNSPYCTAYGAFGTYSHWYGNHPDKSMRKDFLDYALEKNIIFDTEERSGGSTVRTAFAWQSRFNNNQKGKRANAYAVRMGTPFTNALMTWGKHAVSSSFIITEDFVRDRYDNKILDGMVHGGKKYNGHCLLETYYTKSSILGYNNYGKDKNFLINGKEYLKKRYDTSFHRKRWVIITYQDL